MVASKQYSDVIIYALTLTPYLMATINRFFAKTNKAQGTKNRIKDADHAQLLGTNEYALMREDNLSFSYEDDIKSNLWYFVCFSRKTSIQTAISIVSVNTNDFLCANILNIKPSSATKPRD